MKWKSFTVQVTLSVRPSVGRAIRWVLFSEILCSEGKFYHCPALTALLSQSWILSGYTLQRPFRLGESSHSICLESPLVWQSVQLPSSSRYGRVQEISIPRHRVYLGHRLKSKKRKICKVPLTGVDKDARAKSVETTGNHWKNREMDPWMQIAC